MKPNVTDLGQIAKIFTEGIEQISKETQEQEEKRKRIERFVGFFSRVNSAFTFRPVTVTVEHAQIKAPAWSGSDTVTFNANEIGELNTPESIAGIKGLDLHEVSHILYTPRESSDIVQWVIDNRYWGAFNALEDQRIESFFTSKYPSTVPWFTAVILIHFKSNDEIFAKSYPLLCGRKYLPVELRRQSRALYPEHEKVSEFLSIVDSYRTVVFPADTEKAKELIKSYHDLLPTSEDGEGEGEGEGEGTGKKYKAVKGGIGDENGTPISVIDPFGHGLRPVEGIESSNSRPVPPRQQTRERDRMLGKDVEGDDLPITPSEKPPMIVDADDIDWSDFDSDDEEVTPDSPAGDDEVTPDLEGDDAEGDAEQSDTPSLTAGAEAGVMIETILGDLLSESGVAQEIDDIIRIISGLPTLASNNSKEPERARWNNLVPDSATVEASRSFGRELERLRIEHEPNWDRFENSGRVNIGRHIQGEAFDTIFDQWNEGREDATDIECVIALDNSGSMSGTKIANANRAMYAVKRALDRIDASTTVLTFDDQTRVLYRGNEKSDSSIRDAFSGGGTTPDYAIKYATKLLAESERKVKVFFIITDGAWYGDQRENHEAIDRMSRAGVLTSFAYIPETTYDSFSLTAESAHHCEVGAIISNPFDIVTMARAIVKYAISRRLVNA